MAAFESSLEALEFLFQQGTAPGDDESPDAGTAAATKQVIAGAEDAVSSLILVCEKVESQSEAVLTAVMTLHTATGESAEVWRESIDTLVLGLSKLDENVREVATEALSSSLDRVDNSIRVAAHNLETTWRAVDEIFEGSINYIDEHLQGHVEDATNEFLEYLQGGVRNPLAETLEQVQQDSELRIRELGDSTLAAAALTRDHLETSLDALLGQLQSEGRQSLERARDQLIDAATRRLSDAATEVVTQSGVAATLSGAMAPALPTMLAIKHIADSLLDAIEAWKAMRMGL